MADIAHLEKMGRELNCPICLSLLESAASLLCNHVFCNSCIVELMKSSSDCPVCKVPFRRREIRAAPHMDSLVSIYKSMEVAAGTNIFSTQVSPRALNSEASKENNNQKHLAETKTQAKTKKRSTKRTCSQKNQKESLVNARSGDHLPMKPSFPAKKRIHVMPIPISETPVRPMKIYELESPANNLTHTKESEEDTSITTKKKEVPSLSPFFWLGEEDQNEDTDNISSYQTPSTPSSQTAPCFSDIKDSEDEMPTEDASLGASSAAEVFDSEIFEWTQRPCSPELCSTPIKNEHVKVQNEKCQEGSNIVALSEKTEVEIPNAKKVLKKSERLKRRIPSSSKRTPLKRTKRDLSKISETANSEKEGGRRKRLPFLEKITVDEAKNSASCEQKNCKIPPNQNLDATLVESSKKCRNIGFKANERDMGKGNESVDKRSIEPNMTNSVPKRKCTRLSLTNSTVERPKILASFVNKVEAKNQVSQTRYIQKQNREDLVHATQNQQSEEMEFQREAAEQPDHKDVNHIHSASVEITCPQDNQAAKNLDQKLQMTFQKESRGTSSQNLNNLTLRKCKDLSPFFECAFCHSSTSTEVSGEIMHYFSGKLVNADFNGGINVIHAHKHCTEWAPDIYFEDDLAVNLITELARSRRIKCSCCGIKGAALGCYEKSCRKSFHYTCAMLIPECRWDTENFVMLCPVHSSLKLPIEISESPRRSMKRSICKRKSLASSTHKACIDQCQKRIWTSGSPCKWILCGSALSAVEKEELHNFAKLTGASISHSWHPEATHVIASTCENGACKRTLKVLKAILDGKWVLRFDWVRECAKAMQPLDEENFEITSDVHGISKGPQLGRLRAMNKEPKLFDGFTFYLSGNYTLSYKGYLQELLIAAGGTILQRKPISRDQERMVGDYSTSMTLIVYSLESAKNNSSKQNIIFNDLRGKAQALADASGGRAVSSIWIIDSIAGCKMQPL